MPTPHNPLLAALREIRAGGRVALCGYFLTGYPTPEAFYRMVRAATALDVIEFGIPAPNPAMDGPVIASAHGVVTEFRGLGAETSLALLGGLRELRQPRFVMTYADVGRGQFGFLRLCATNGIHGMLAPDLLPEEIVYVVTVARALDLAVLTLVDAHSAVEQPDDPAFAWAVEYGDIVYVKAGRGRTGQSADADAHAALAATVARLRAARPELPIAVGIGVQQPEQVAALAALGIDMVVVGTRIIEHLDSGETALLRYIDSLRAATTIPG
jgi:tryptophan synthase alpha chain